MKEFVKRNLHSILRILQIGALCWVALALESIAENMPDGRDVAREIEQLSGPLESIQETLDTINDTLTYRRN